MRTETRYVSEDGSVWESEDDALERDLVLQLEKDIESFLAEPGNEAWRARGQEARFRAAVRSWESWMRRRGLQELELVGEPAEEVAG